MGFARWSKGEQIDGTAERIAAARILGAETLGEIDRGKCRNRQP